MIFQNLSNQATTKEEAETQYTKSSNLRRLFLPHVANYKDDFNVLLTEAKNRASLVEIDKFVGKKTGKYIHSHRSDVY